MFDTEALIEEWLARLDTSSLRQGDAPTRVLVVLNQWNEAYSGPVRFAAAFPIRAASDPPPVTVRDIRGNIVPSRLTVSAVSERPDLPANRVWWTMELEFVAGDVPAQGWRSFSSAFAWSAESRSEDAAFWSAQPPAPPEIRVAETECHHGDLPLTGYFADITNSQTLPPTEQAEEYD